jgi:Spy/CpxP family protein refolding chaperone
MTHTRREKINRTKERPLMKLLKTTLTIALFAAASAGASFAQTTAPHVGHGMHQPGERINKVLNLDATRAAQVTAIMTEQRAQGKALWEANKGSTDREAKRAQMRALHDATQAKLATVLSADEMAKLKEARKAMHHGHGPKQG